MKDALERALAVEEDASVERILATQFYRPRASTGALAAVLNLGAARAARSGDVER